MIPLFKEQKWGRRPISKNTTAHKPLELRPKYSYRYDPIQGITRLNVSNWPIEGFSDQDVAIDFSLFSSWAKRPLRAIEMDWLNLAIAIYSADRFSARRPSASVGDKYWRRSISLEVAVANPDVWNASKSAILEALQFLTDDDWTLEFTERKILLVEESQMHIKMDVGERPSWVCLFSGGLDSLAGLMHLSRKVGGRGLMVSGWTNERLKVGQKETVAQLPKHGVDSCDWLQVHYGFPKIKYSDFMESSQRSRGWMHVALGLTALAVSDNDVLDICENGIGAMNLPTEFSQTGSHTSRAVHPVFLSRIAKVASILFDRKFSIRQSALFETKAELLRRTLLVDDAKLIDSSFSCEFFPNYNAKQSQCGVCPSCLVRRAALSAAALPDNGKRYANDIIAKLPPSKKMHGLIKMRRFVDRIDHCCNDFAAQDAVLWEYPEAGSFFEEAAVSLSLTKQDFLKEINRMHQSFALEWKTFFDHLPLRLVNSNVA